MAVTKKIEIDGQEVEFRASAAVPRMYRLKFGRDIYKDLRQLEKSVGDNDEDESSLDLFSLEQFNTFSIYQILPELIDLWGLNVQMTTPLFLLRCVQLGISIRDLDLLTIGLVNDLFTESMNDSYPYKDLASQHDFDVL